jgi:hypothetical protein
MFNLAVFSQESSMARRWHAIKDEGWKRMEWKRIENVLSGRTDAGRKPAENNRNRLCR